MKTFLSLLTLLKCVSAQAYDAVNSSAALTFTISPKIWGLLEENADYIRSIATESESNAGRGEFLDFIKYKMDYKLEQYEIPKTGISFEDMDSGVHLKIKDMSFRVPVKITLYVGDDDRVDLFTGGIVLSSSNVEVDILLEWSDFKFIPSVSTDSKIEIEFEDDLQQFNRFKGVFRKLITQVFKKKLVELVKESVRDILNPWMQEFKEKLNARARVEYDIEWTTQNHTLRMAFKPKRSVSDEVLPINQTDKMMCMEVNVEKMAADLDVECYASPEDPNIKCGGNLCSFCLDIRGDLDDLHIPQLCSRIDFLEFE